MDVYQSISSQFEGGGVSFQEHPQRADVPSGWLFLRGEMMMTRHRLRLVLAATVLGSLGVSAALVACSAPEATPKNTLTTREDDAGKKEKDTGTPVDEPPAKPPADPPLPDGGKPPGLVFGHTSDTLYLWEPLSKKLTMVGKFDCLNPGDRVLDIALDRNGMMYGTSDDGFLQIDVLDAKCTYKHQDPSAQYPNSLAFVPLGTVDPTKEALVGYQFDDKLNATIYAQINLDDGSITKVGDLNDPAAAIKYKSSGDLISLIRNGKKAYLTVKNIDKDAGTGNDYLAEIDPATGRLKTILGDTKMHDLWGLGQWAGTAYGFSGTGDLVQINMTNGSTSKVLTLTGDAGTLQWFGAGVTTDSPTAP